MIGLQTLSFRLCAVAALVLVSGCNLPSLLIKGTVDGTREFTKERGTHFADPENVGPLIQTATVTNEGLIYYVPDYEPLLMSAIFSNVAYGVGWLLAEGNEAEIKGDFDTAEKLQARAGILFGRALFYSKRMLRLRDSDFDEAMASGDDNFRRWVDQNFYQKDDAEPALIAGLGFLVAMIESDEGLAAAVDLPVARYLIEKSIELDPELNGGQGMVLIGTIECTMPALVGGRPKLGLQLMQRAAAMDNETNHSILVSMAERCAVALQDRKMFTEKLMKVIESGDVEEYRLPNKLARHQAERLLKQQDEFFYD
jgi:hypothetical protein